MWRTPEGERVLKGAEGRLLRASLAGVVELLEEDLRAIEWFDEDEDCVAVFEVPLFDELETGQKLVLMAQVGKALFDQSVPWPRHTAVAEAAIYVLYQNIVDEIGTEIAAQVQRGRRWRK